MSDLRDDPLEGCLAQKVSTVAQTPALLPMSGCRVYEDTETRCLIYEDREGVVPLRNSLMIGLLRVVLRLERRVVEADAHLEVDFQASAHATPRRSQRILEGGRQIWSVLGLPLFLVALPRTIKNDNVVCYFIS